MSYPERLRGFNAQLRNVERVPLVVGLSESCCKEDMQQPSRVQYLYLCLHGRRREVFLKGLEGVISLFFLLEDTSHPLVLLQTLHPQRSLRQLSVEPGLYFLLCRTYQEHISLQAAYRSLSSLESYRKEVLSSHAMPPAASLKAYDGHSSSFGLLATCSRPVLRSSAAAVVTSSFMTPLTTSGRGRM